MNTAAPSTTTTAPEKPNKPSHVKDLVLLFSIPLGIALLAALAVYVPRLMANPAYDFIYSYCPSYQCSDSYSIGQDGRLAQSSTSDRSRYYAESYPASKLGYYEAATGATRFISYQEAQGYKLINSSISPDGYSLVRESDGGGGFLFGGDYERTWKLKSGLKQKPVQLSGGDPYYSDDTDFIGWVQK